MDNPGEIMRLCRLCLVKDQVNIPIFDEQGDIRQIFLKISSCLPVKVSREDPLPKSICDGCSNKLDLLYEFRNTSANAEKTLLSWVGQADAKDVDETVTAAAHQVAKPSETQVKQEEVEESNPAPVQDIESMDAQESATFDESSAKDEEEEEPPPPKRARRTAAVKAQINIAPDSDDEDDDDDDLDGAEPMTKIEDESEESDDDKDPSYQDVPGTSADDQPGPSGVGKDGVEAPLAGISFQCNECRKKFSTLGALQVHMTSKCAKAKYLPPTRRITRSKTGVNITRIIITDDEDKELDLNEMSHIFTKLNKSNVKITKASTKKSNQKCFWPCSRCPQIFSSEVLLNTHLVKCLSYVELPNPQNTRKREKPELSSIDETYHYNKHEQVYVCSECCAVFSDKPAIEEHVKIHPSIENREIKENDTKWNCIVCNKDFINKGRLWSHQRYRHKAATGAKPSMGAHLENPGSTTPSEPHVYLCDICGKNFNSNYRLDRHIKAMHEHLKPYICRYCGRAFTGKDTMKKHERIHTGERPYSCEYCGKCFRQQGPFSVHLRIHTGERPYQCKFCKKGFITNQSKKTHMNTCRGRELSYMIIVDSDNVDKDV